VPLVTFRLRFVACHDVVAVFGFALSLLAGPAGVGPPGAPGATRSGHARTIVRGWSSSIIRCAKCREGQQQHGADESCSEELCKVSHRHPPFE